MDFMKTESFWIFTLILMIVLFEKSAISDSIELYILFTVKLFACWFVVFIQRVTFSVWVTHNFLFYKRQCNSHFFLYFQSTDKMISIVTMNFIKLLALFWFVTCNSFQCFRINYFLAFCWYFWYFELYCRESLCFLQIEHWIFSFLKSVIVCTTIVGKLYYDFQEIILGTMSFLCTYIAANIRHKQKYSLIFENTRRLLK